MYMVTAFFCIHCPITLTHHKQSNVRATRRIPRNRFTTENKQDRERFECKVVKQACTARSFWSADF